MNVSTPLEGQTAVVTGASSGIGRAISEHLGKAGAHVYLCGRTITSMEASQKIIEDSGGKATIFTADIQDAKQIQKLVSSAVNKTSRLDIMVNCAGVSYTGSIIEGDVEEWRSMLDINILALLVGCQAAVKAMRACSAQGHIVNISSVSAQRNNTGVYGSTKHAVNVISSSLRDELEEDTIRVTNVMPGATATNFARNFDQEFIHSMIKMAGIETETKPGEHLPRNVLNKLAENMKQLLSDPNDVAKAVLYAVTQPIEVNIAEIVVRPPKAMNIPH